MQGKLGLIYQATPTFGNEFQDINHCAQQIEVSRANTGID